MKHCCTRMTEQVQHRCDVHADPAGCPDALVGYFGGQYGIRVHDGGSSFVVILHCPWCGTRLRKGSGKASVRRTTNAMPPLKRRAELDTINGLTAAIWALPSDKQVPKGTQGYNRYSTQRDHWLGWLGVTPGSGSFERKTANGRGASYVYNHIGEPKMLLWLIEASKVDPILVAQARRGASAAHKLAAGAKAVRQAVPYSVVADALWKQHAV